MPTPRIPILDVHAHFPMQLRIPPRVLPNDLRNRLLFKAAKALLNDESGRSRVRLPASRRLNVSFGSVLYNPADEFCAPDGPFSSIQAQIDLVEARLASTGGDFVIVRNPVQLEEAIAATPRGGPQAVFHTIEAGYGVEDPSRVPDLAAAGVAYITLAHLLFRGVSPSVNAFPCFTDSLYQSTFHQPPGGLTPLGREILEAMLECGIVPDITHMADEAVQEVFDAAGSTGTPVIYSHGGVRDLSPYDYNLSESTIRRVAASGGVFGVIFSDHWLMPAAGVENPPAADIGRVIDAIEAVRAITGDDHIVIGSDFDGFIKPVAGLEDYDAFDNLRAALLSHYDAGIVEKILWKNAVASLKRGWGRRRAPRGPSVTVLAVSPPSTTLPGPPEIEGIAFEGGVYPAQTVADVQEIVRAARAKGRRVRVVGSNHSVPDAVFSPDEEDVRVVLRGDELRHRRLEPGGFVSVGGGCYLGRNPLDSSSTVENSLNAFLDDHDFALPILGGITHQTIAGFMQTGSSGGSTRYGFASAVEEIELVNGLGEIVVCARGSREWQAAGVAMGLLGVLTRVKVKPEPRYFVKGTESNHDEAESLIAKDAQGRYPLAAALRDTDYLHLDWFPQRFVKKVGQWLGSRGDVVSNPDPYRSELNSPVKNLLAALVLALADDALQIDPDSDGAQRMVGALLNQFVRLDLHETFNNAWHQVLPADDQVSVDTLIRIVFTEIWIALDRLTETLDRLHELLTGDPAAAANFAVELYGAAESPFWLSPSNGTPVVRVDVFWWAHNIGDPRAFFAKYWKTLLEIPGTRFHWGKHLPDVGVQYGSVTFGPDLLRERYDHWQDWLDMRARMDPDGVFLTDYWKRILGIA